MKMIPPFDEAEILRRVGERSFERGRRYFKARAILNARRQGMTLRADCEGSRPDPYCIRVGFNTQGIEEAYCSCPVGEGGHCKHVAALLLTWLHRPEQFREVAEVEQALEQRSKAELIALIRQMLLRRPELEALLEMLLERPLPASGSEVSRRKRRMPVDPEVYRRQAAATFHYAPRDFDDWGVEAQIARELKAIVALGDGFDEQEDWTSAVAVYQGVSVEVLSHYEMFRDESGELGLVVQRCVEGLGKCLARADEPRIREQILKALFEVYRFDVEFGGVGLGDGVPEIVLTHTTAEERRRFVDWVRSALPDPESGDWSAAWQREVLGGFLLQLEGEDLDDERFLEICRETGRLPDLVERLLRLGRGEEAEAEAQGANDYELLKLAEIFVGHGQAEAAERLMVERAKTAEDRRILEWLQARYAARADLNRALEVAQRLFEKWPGLDYYRSIRVLAGQLDQWERLRLKLLKTLSSNRCYSLLIDIHVDEGEIDEALKTLKRGKALGAGYLLKVARAAERSRPAEAIELYQQLAERLIAARGRENYREACDFLRRIKGLLGEGEAWRSYLAELRERNRNLRALQDELAAAGL